MGSPPHDAGGENETQHDEHRGHRNRNAKTARTRGRLERGGSVERRQQIVGRGEPVSGQLGKETLNQVIELGRHGLPQPPD